MSTTTLKNTNLLVEAAERGDATEVQRLIPVSDPKHNGSCALSRAAVRGYAACVELLIPVSDPKADDSYALCGAVGNGHIECVKLLIPVSDPKDDESRALRWAAINMHTDCVDVLLNVSDPQVVVHHLQKKYFNQPEKWQYLEEKVNEQQREILNAVLENTSVQLHIKHTRKI